MLPDEPQRRRRDQQRYRIGHGHPQHQASQPLHERLAPGLMSLAPGSAVCVVAQRRHSEEPLAAARSPSCRGGRTASTPESRDASQDARQLGSGCGVAKPGTSPSASRATAPPNSRMLGKAKTSGGGLTGAYSMARRSGFRIDLACGGGLPGLARKGCRRLDSRSLLRMEGTRRAC
jgi:hypothetical protein